MSVVTGEEGRVHPTRRKMAGLPEAEVFDQLLIAQQGLEGGGAGSNKLLSCSRTTLKNIAKMIFYYRCLLLQLQLQILYQDMEIKIS